MGRSPASARGRELDFPPGSRVPGSIPLILLLSPVPKAAAAMRLGIADLESGQATQSSSTHPRRAVLAGGPLIPYYSAEHSKGLNWSTTVDPAREPLWIWCPTSTQEGKRYGCELSARGSTGMTSKKNSIGIRYGHRADLPYLQGAFDRFQRESVARDPMRRTRRKRGYGAMYARLVLRVTRKREGFVLVAEQKSRPIGFIVTLPEPPPPHARYDSVPSRPCLIWELWVEPAHRSKGVGKRLLEEAETRFRARGYDWVHLFVAAANPRARDFYRRAGFVERWLDVGKPIAGPQKKTKVTRSDPELTRASVTV
jgi:ribosomal protein S18 acetylase RimI-like enzyme